MVLVVQCLGKYMNMKYVDPYCALSSPSSSSSCAESVVQPHSTCWLKLLTCTAEEGLTGPNLDL